MRINHSAVGRFSPSRGMGMIAGSWDGIGRAYANMAIATKNGRVSRLCSITYSVSPPYLFITRVKV